MAGPATRQAKGAQPETILQIALREGRRPFLFAGLFSLVTNALYLALPIYTNQVFVRVLSSESNATLIVLTFGTLFVFAVSSVIDVYRARVLESFGVAFDQRATPHIFSALHEAAARNQRTVGAQPLRDFDTIRQAITGSAIQVFFDLPWLPIYLIVLFVIDPLVGAITGVGGAILLGLAFLQDRASRPAMKAAGEAAIKSYGFTDAGLRNSEVVRAMGMLPYIGRQWGAQRIESLNNSIEAGRHVSVWGSASRFVRSAVQILVIGAGAYLVIQGQIGPGLLFANMILSSRALMPIERAVGSWGQVVSARLAYERLNDMLRSYEAPSEGTSLPRPRGDLTVEGLNYAAPGGGLILTGVNMRVNAGEYLGLIGPSGAGKSTLVRLLVGVWKPLNGAVRLDGADVYTWDREDLGRHMGYLPQDTELFDGSVRDNIARFAIDVTDEEVVAAAQAANAHDLILRLPQGYDTVLGQGGAVLSAGQRQRVGLARALLREPALIVLDEPNANLDVPGEEALLKALDGAKARGATIVVVSHKPSLLRAADKLLVLKNGRVDAFGPREAVMQRLAAAQAPAKALPGKGAAKPAATAASPAEGEA